MNFDALIRVIAPLLTALADGKIDPDEAQEVITAAGKELAVVAEDQLPGLIAKLEDFVGDLLHPDVAEIRTKADKAEADGEDDKAARLRERADRVEARRSF